MNIHVHLLQATGRLDSFATLLRSVADKTILEITQLMPVKDVDIVLSDSPDRAIRHLGIGGYTPTPHVIYISLDPQKDNFAVHIEKDLPRTLAHELHHALRWGNPGYGTTLLEAMVSEGLADHFAIEVAKGNPDLWDTALSEDQINHYFGLARNEFYNSQYNHQEWFFGSEKIPHWAGYTLGFQLVAEYLKKHPSQKASTLYNVNAKEFLMV